MMAMRRLLKMGCQQVSSPAWRQSRSLVKASGSLERHRKQAVRLFMRKGTGSMESIRRWVVRSAMPTPVPLPWLSGDKSRAQMRVIAGVGSSTMVSTNRRPTTLGSIPAPL